MREAVERSRILKMDCKLSVDEFPVSHKFAILNELAIIYKFVVAI